MKKIFINVHLIGLLLGYANFCSVFEIPQKPVNQASIAPLVDPEPELKQEAFKVLKTKCNVCHKKRNPFKIFSLKNMDKHAPKIYKQVFVYERMPKGDKVKLTEEEYQTLKNWLKSKNIY